MRATGRSARGTGLQSGLVFAHDFSEGRNPSRKRNPNAPPTSHDPIYWTGLQSGSSYKWGKSVNLNTGGASVIGGNTSIVFAKQALTLFYSGRWVAQGSGNAFRMGVIWTDGGSNFSSIHSGGNHILLLNTAGTWYRTNLNNMLPTFGDYFTLSVSWPAGEAVNAIQSVQCFRDGVKRTHTPVGTSGAVAVPLGKLKFGTYGNMPTEGASEIFQMAMWTRQLSDAEHYAIHRDPGLVTRSTVGAGRSIPGLRGNFIHQGGYSFSRGA